MSSRDGTVVVLLLLCLGWMVAGCAALQQRFQAGGGRQEIMAVEQFEDAGDLASARNAYLAIARDRAGTPLGEQAAYRAALLLVDPRNESQDFAQAGREFAGVAEAYPKGRHVREAAAWAALLRSDEMARTQSLQGQVGSLQQMLKTERSGRATAESALQASDAESDRLRKAIEKDQEHIDTLLREKEGLLQKQRELLAERDGLAKDRDLLEKKIGTLTKEKEWLQSAKAKLEKRLRDVTAVDVQMERTRRKVK